MTVAPVGAANILVVSDGIIAHSSSGPGNWPLFQFDDTLAGVTIIDHSDATLRIGDIDVVAPAAAQPTVWLVTGERHRPDQPRNAVYAPVRRPPGFGRVLRRHPEAGDGIPVPGRGHQQPGRLDARPPCAGDILSAGTRARITANAVHLEAPVGSSDPRPIGVRARPEPGCRQPARHLRRRDPDDPAVGDGGRPDRAPPRRPRSRAGWDLGATGPVPGVRRPPAFDQRLGRRPARRQHPRPRDGSVSGVLVMVYKTRTARSRRPTASFRTTRATFFTSCPTARAPQLSGEHAAAARRRAAPSGDQPRSTAPTLRPSTRGTDSRRCAGLRDHLVSELRHRR